MIEPGKYYKVVNMPGKIFQATLCTFCGLRKVVNYKTCLFRKRGMITFPGEHRLPLLDCVDSSSVVEVTEEAYIGFMVNKHY